ncbi:hypothetical protein J6590_105719, partial [Homalodisca vitripennis]
ESAPSGPSQEVCHGCRGRTLHCYGRPPARLVSGAGSTEVGPQGTGVEAKFPEGTPVPDFRAALVARCAGKLKVWNRKNPLKTIQRG